MFFKKLFFFQTDNYHSTSAKQTYWSKRHKNWCSSSYDYHWLVAVKEWLNDNNLKKYKTNYIRWFLLLAYARISGTWGNEDWTSGWLYYNSTWMTISILNYNWNYYYYHHLLLLYNLKCKKEKKLRLIHKGMID